MRKIDNFNSGERSKLSNGLRLLGHTGQFRGTVAAVNAQYGNAPRIPVHGDGHLEAGEFKGPPHVRQGGADFRDVFLEIREDLLGCLMGMDVIAAGLDDDGLRRVIGTQPDHVSEIGGVKVQSDQTSTK